MRSISLAVILCSLALPLYGQYSARQDGDVVRLEDAKRQTVVSVMPAHGNNAFEMKVKGKDVLQFPFASAAEFKSKGELQRHSLPGPVGQPARRNGASTRTGKSICSTRDWAMSVVQSAMHGFLVTAPWEVVDVKADQESAWVTSRMEVYRQPDWMAQFPFAHTIEMTYRLKDGTLEVALKLINLSAAPMPVAIGFHPYFQVNDAPRDEWTFSVGAKTHWIGNRNIPTGETEPIEKVIPNPAGGTLKGMKLDDVFGDLVREPSGKATMWVQGKAERVEVTFGPKYRAAVVYFPAGPGQNFICFEPMAGITDSMNLAQKGLYKELQYIAPGQSWEESFWIKPSGF